MLSRRYKPHPRGACLALQSSLLAVNMVFIFSFGEKKCLEIIHVKEGDVCTRSGFNEVSPPEIRHFLSLRLNLGFAVTKSLYFTVSCSYCRIGIDLAYLERYWLSCKPVTQFNTPSLWLPVSDGNTSTCTIKSCLRSYFVRSWISEAVLGNFKPSNNTLSEQQDTKVHVFIILTFSTQKSVSSVSD